MTTIVLKPHKEESLKRFHPWVFSGAIGRVVLDKDYPFDTPQEGEVVLVTDANNQPLGVGHYQIGSIAVRMLEFGVSTLPHDFYEQRIAAAYRLRKDLQLIRKDNNTYRLIHGEGDFLPGLVVDIYANTAVVQAHSVGMHLVREEIADAIVKVVKEVKNVYYKSDDTLPFKAPITGDKVGYLINKDVNKDEDQVFWSKENGLEFRIDWLRGQKTGFFVDQRENRALLEHYAKDKEVLNMFCYSGGFSLHALAHGAELRHADAALLQKAVDLPSRSRSLSKEQNARGIAVQTVTDARLKAT